MKIEHTSMQNQRVEAQSQENNDKVERLELLNRASASIAQEESATVDSQLVKERVAKAIVDINDFIKPMHGQKVSFELREDIDEAIAFVRDKQTGEVIRQVPSEEILKIHAQIRALQEQGGSRDALSLLSDFRV